jgi:hypothetical protein
MERDELLLYRYRMLTDVITQHGRYSRRLEAPAEIVRVRGAK